MAHGQITALLTGTRTYDGLSETEQAVVRSLWDVQITARREALNLAERFQREGRSFVELDDGGNVVTHPAKA